MVNDCRKETEREIGSYLLSSFRISLTSKEMASYMLDYIRKSKVPKTMMAPDEYNERQWKTVRHNL